MDLNDEIHTSAKLRTDGPRQTSCFGKTWLGFSYYFLLLELQTGGGHSSLAQFAPKLQHSRFEAEKKRKQKPYIYGWLPFKNGNVH